MAETTPSLKDIALGAINQGREQRAGYLGQIKEGVRIGKEGLKIAREAGKTAWKKTKSTGGKVGRGIETFDALVRGLGNPQTEAALNAWKQEKVNNGKEWLGDKWEGVKDKFNSGRERAVTGTMDQLRGLRDEVKDRLITPVKDGAKKIGENVAGAAREGKLFVVDAGKFFGEVGVGAGKDIVHGVGRGLQEVGNVASAGGNIAAEAGKFMGGVAVGAVVEGAELGAKGIGKTIEGGKAVAEYAENKAKEWSGRLGGFFTGQGERAWTGIQARQTEATNAWNEFLKNRYDKRTQKHEALAAKFRSKGEQAREGSERAQGRLQTLRSASSECRSGSVGNGNA